MASNRTSMHLTLAPVVTMKIHCTPKLGSANQVITSGISSAIQSSHHYSDSGSLCRVSDTDHKYAEKVDMEFNKLIECIEERMSDDNDIDDDNIVGVFEEKSDCLVSIGKKNIQESVPVTTWITSKTATDCKVGHHFLKGEGHDFVKGRQETKEEEKEKEEKVKDEVEKEEEWQNSNWKNSRNKTDIARLMVSRHIERFCRGKSFNNERADGDVVFVQNAAARDLTPGRLVHLSIPSNQLECPVSPTSITIDDYRDEIKMANNHANSNSETRGKGAATTFSINSLSACSLSTKAITTGVSAAASSTSNAMATSQYKKSADEKLSHVSIETWACQSPITSPNAEFRNHSAFTPVHSSESLSSLLSPSSVTKESSNTTGVVPRVSTLKHPSSNVGDIISIPRYVINPKNQFQSPELQVIVPNVLDCSIDNSKNNSNKNNNNNHNEESVTEDVEDHSFLTEKPLSYSSSISLFTSGSVDAANAGSSGLIFAPFCCTLSPSLETIPPAHRSSSQTLSNPKNAVNFSSPLQSKSAQVHFHGPMTHTLVPKVEQDQFPYSLTGSVNKKIETVNNGNNSASNCTTSCVVNTTKTTTTTMTTTATIVLTGSKERELDTATSTTTTTTTTFPTLVELGRGYNLQGDCDRSSGSGVGSGGGDDDDEGCIGSTKNYSPNTNCYFCKTPVTDLDKSARFYGSNRDANYCGINESNKKKEFSKEGPVPKEYQTEKKVTMLKSSLDLYLENAWSPMDATLKEKKPRVRDMNTNRWKEEMTTSIEKMDNEDVTNKGYSPGFTLSKWEKVTTEADDNNNNSSNGNCLWIEGENEDESCPTMKEFELDNGRTIMTVISIKSNKKKNFLDKADDKESLIISSLPYPQQSAPKTPLTSEKQSQNLVNSDESKLYQKRKDLEPRFEMSTPKTQLTLNKTKEKTPSNINLGSKLAEDNCIEKMSNSNLTKKPQSKETNCVREMTKAIETKISRNNSFSNSPVDKASYKRLTPIDSPHRTNPRRYKTFPQIQYRPQFSKSVSDNSEQTTFISHVNTIPTVSHFINANEQPVDIFSERNENESRDLKKEFPMKEFIIRTNEIGGFSDQNCNIIEVGEKFPAFNSPVSTSTPISRSRGSSCTEHPLTVSDEGHLNSSVKLPKSLIEKSTDRHLSQTERDLFTKTTDKETDQVDSSAIKKTTEIRVQLCPPKTPLRLKSLQSVNPVGSSSIRPFSTASVIGNELYCKKDYVEVETDSVIEKENVHQNMAAIDTSCVVTDIDIGNIDRSEINGSPRKKGPHLVVKEIVLNPSEDKINLVSNCHRKPMFLSPLKDEDRVAGEPLTLRCEVVGWPEPKISWIFDGITLDCQEPYQSYYDGRVAMLQLSEILPSDEGTYTCLAQNDAGECETKAKLTVLGFAPDIYEPLDSAGAKLGCPIRIQCRMKANPPAKISWTLNGQPLESNRYVRLSSNGDLYMVDISQLKSEDAGCYTFQAVNPFGDAMCTASISIEESNDQRRRESDVRRLRPEVLNILRPLSKRMLFSDRARTFASEKKSPGSKFQVAESKIHPIETTAIQSKNNNLSIEDSTDSKNESTVLSGSKDLSNRNLDTITGITTMMNRTAKEMDTAVQEAGSEEAWFSPHLPSTASNPPFLTYPTGNSIQKLVSIVKSSPVQKSSSSLISINPIQVNQSRISTTAFATRQILTTRGDFLQTTTATMTSYDEIENEDELHEMLDKAENFEERKKIRARIREIRDQKMKEWEEKRLENEKIASDALKEKVKRADEEKERKMQAYKEKSNITATSEDRRLQASQDGLKDRQRQADEEKRKKLELYGQIAKQENTTKTLAAGDKKDGAVEKAKEDDDKPKETTETTSVTSKDGKTTTVTTVQTIIDKNETRIITTEVATKTMPDGGTSTKTSKRTKIIQSQMGFGGAMAAPGGLAPAGRGRGITRSPSAIKQMLLEWTKAMTQEYSDKVVITNFSSSWNNGMAFCALIHHFFPDAFDFDALDPKKRRHNFNLAFDTAEKLADIAPLLDTDDMVRMKNPDWKCVFTYVQSFYRKLQSHEKNKALPRPDSS